MMMIIVMMMRMMVRYGLQMTLGDQDWFTVLGYELPHLFYHLPCRFNMQTSVQVGEQIVLTLTIIREILAKF